MKIDLKSHCDEVQSKMKEKLEALSSEETDLTARYCKAIVLLVEIILELKEFVKSYEFRDQDEEIHFFKHIKPIFLSQYYFHKDALALKQDEPSRLSGDLQVYYGRALERIQAFNKANADFIRYCLSGERGLDDKYFVRGFVSEMDLSTDRSFSTEYDERLSRIIANRVLKDHVTSLADSLNASGDSTESSLTWTGSKSDLIELIYGLETVGVINKGKADIKEIARRFEILFNINLENLYRQFLDIRLRKKEKTTFLNDMKQKLEVRMDDFK